MGNPISGLPVFLLFLVKHALVSIGPEFQPRQPRRRPAHLLGDVIQRCTLADFDDKFVMDVADDTVVGEAAHGVAEDVPADSLGNIFHKFGTVAFDSAPVFGTVDAHIRYGLTAKAVFADPRFHIGKAPAAGKMNE